MIVSREIALLAAELGRVHRARGELDRAQQIESELGAELAQIEAALERERPRTGEVLDAEAQAAKRAREPLPPPARDPGRQGAGETDDVKRVIGPLRGGGVGGGRTGLEFRDERIVELEGRLAGRRRDHRRRPEASTSGLT